MSDWQPIETAPKDWTHVLLAFGSSVAEGYWLEGADLWLYANTSIDDESCIIDDPTHWMPLPAPPVRP